MKESIKSYDNGDVVDILGIYENKIELMHYMLDQMRSELHAINKLVDNELITNSGFKCLEVLEQLSYDNLSYVHEEMVKYKTEWDNEE